MLRELRVQEDHQESEEFQVKVYLDPRLVHMLMLC